MECLYCKEKEIENDAKYCTNCGEEFFSFAWWRVWLIILAISSCILVLIDIEDSIGIYISDYGVISLIKVLFQEMMFETLMYLLMFFLFVYLLINAYNYGKYSFLILTIISLNPILWVINGIYLKNRWEHPLINQKNNIFMILIKSVTWVFYFITILMGFTIIQLLIFGFDYHARLQELGIYTFVNISVFVISIVVATIFNSKQKDN